MHSIHNDCRQVVNCNTNKLEILSADKIAPEFHELGILSGYRKPPCSFKLGFLSIFQLHNETLNIWTQIVPAFYFISELFLCFFHLGERFLLLYLITITLFLFTSSCAHTFSCLSPRSRHVCFFLDYVGITTYSSGCAACYYAFALPVDFMRLSSSIGLNVCDIYLFISILLCIWGTHLSCETRFWKPSLFRNFVRMGAFAINLIYLAVPVLWRVISCSRESDTASNYPECASAYYWSLHFLFTFTAGILYLSHFPERMFPGKFDTFGHSHQLFHVFSALGSVMQYYALRTDLRYRTTNLKLMLHAPSIPLSLLCIVIVVLSNTFIFFKFCKRLGKCQVLKQP